ncbi:trigger factor family protein, partial [Negativicoccus succinicivorans]
MKVEVKPVDQHQVSLLIEVPADAVNQGIQSAVQRISNQVTIPGFRKGKTPRKILEAHFGKDAIMAEASDLIVNKYYDEALREQNLVPVTRADVDVEQFEEGKDMKFKVTFIKKPEVKLGDYKELNVEHKHQKVTDKMVDEQLEAIAKQ